MGKKTGSQIVAEALRREGVEDFFFINGSPMNLVEAGCLELGIRGIDVRHEQAAAMSALAYARLRRIPGVCLSSSGPGTINIMTGLAHAWMDGVPVVALGGAAPDFSSHRGAFQDCDQIGMMKACTKFAVRVHETERIPELLSIAMRTAMTGKPGPVYVELPGDVLYREIDESRIKWPPPWRHSQELRPSASQRDIEALVQLLKQSRQPVVVSGSGILWSRAEDELQSWITASGIPFFTTPQSRGVVPEDHEYCYPAARTTAFREADLIVIVGTRMNYVISHAQAPRFNADAKIARIDIDPLEIATSPRTIDLGIVADAKQALAQLLEASRGRLESSSYASWRERLRGRNTAEESEVNKLRDEQAPIHPRRLCQEIRDVIGRDAILCVDGQEILHFGRQVIPTYVAGHRLNSGTFGTMGVGMPFGVGAKVAKPNAQVIVLHGDGSFGMNAMEFDTAVRHKLPMLVVISLNGGWTGDPTRQKPGRDLGYTRFHEMAIALGGTGYYVDKPGDIRAALESAMRDVESGKVALVNVVTDWRVQAATTAFSSYVQ